jgi:hypothetical protein
MHNITSQNRGMKRNLSLLASEVAQVRLDTAIRWAESELRCARAAERQLFSLISRLRLVEEDQPPETTYPFGVSGLKRTAHKFP